MGLPLALTFADAGLRTVIYDINQRTVEMIRGGKTPFVEEGGQALLAKVLASGLLEVESTPAPIADCRFLVLVVGTPVDEHLNPSFSAMHKSLQLCREYLREGQILVLRSTVFPGTSQRLQHDLNAQGLKINVAYCPERAVQGQSLKEFRTTPQMISAFDANTLKQVHDLFAPFSCELIEMAPMEAELAKLMCNAWRYVQFATVNQFYMIATQNGLDFNQILHGCKHKYPRMAEMPGPGFAAGPCLVKDTMQLAAFSQNNFVLGHSAMLINEGLPAHVIQLAKRQVDLSQMTAGILGMAFKAESDDHRDSLSYKLRKLLQMECRKVLYTDPYLRTDPGLLPLDTVLAEADILFVGTPHKIYRGLRIPAGKKVVDVWNIVIPADAHQA